MHRDTKQKRGNMAEKNKGDDPTKNSQDPKGASDPSGGTNPDKNGSAEGVFDPAKLSDEQLAKVLEDPRLWKTERLKQLRADSKELKKRKDAESEAENKRLEEEGKFKELLEKNQKDLEKANATIADLTLRGKIADAVVAKGVKDVDAAVKLINRESITKGEDGSYTGITEAVEGLLKERPYLISNQQSVGSPTNPGQSDQPGKYTVSQISDPAFYQENREDIMKAQREGRIVDDRQVATPVAPGQPSPHES